MKRLFMLAMFCMASILSSVSEAANCTGVVSYVAGTSYSQGQQVQNKGNLYTCNVAGWCSSAGAFAYEPGLGSAWQQAWALVGACSGSASSALSSSKASSAQSSSAAVTYGVEPGASSATFFVNITSGFADVHYLKNGAAQQDFSMPIVGSRRAYTLSNLVKGDVIKYWFTYQNPANGLAVDTPSQLYTQGASSSLSSIASSKVSSSSALSSSALSSKASSSSVASSIKSSIASSSSAASSVGDIGAIVPLFNGTGLEPNTVVDTGSAIVTRIGDRARDRHTRDANFQAYAHYLPLYWEYRSSQIEIIDTIAKGGSTITLNVTSLQPMAQPDFRAFFKSIPATYAYNQRMTRLDPYHYTAVIDHHYLYERPLQVGDRMEIEFSPFLSPEPPLTGRTNYYGSGLHYTVGTGGIVPWEAHDATLDSFPIPADNRMGGLVTIPRNYSNEPMQAFKQTAGNMSPTNIQPFLLGRRLHHTDFGDGSHSEVGNPIMANHTNQLGPRYLGRSCLACHLNNGGGLPPGTTAAEFNVQFFVKNSPRADILYTINGVSQAFQMESAGNGLLTWIVRDIPGNANVTYRFTIDKQGGGQIVTNTYSFTMEGGNSATSSLEGYEHGHTTLSPALEYVFKVGIDPAGTPHPNLGKVLQPLAVTGNPEAGVSLRSWKLTNGTYADGSAYQLREPQFEFTGVTPSYFSARISPALTGMGLLEAIDEKTIAALADPNDQNRDGISGRMSTVTDPETGQVRLGRFGWKAAQARLSHQIGVALVNDMGVTNAIFPNPDCGSAQTGCGAAAVEVTHAEIDQWVKYIGLLGVQPRKNMDAQAQTGQALFVSAGCVKCHTPQMKTSPNHPFAELRNQTIWPYSDVLLHDMGTGLSATLGEGTALPSEWRTAPLWNISYRVDVSGGEAYLHDGRARNLPEAILWHGGEAETAKESFRTMSAANRNALLKFLQSL